MKPIEDVPILSEISLFRFLTSLKRAIEELNERLEKLED